MDLPEDPWTATLRFAVVRSTTDENQIMAIAKDELPVTELEVSAELRTFRPLLSGAQSRTMALARQLASGADSGIPAKS